jgi:hypothetical protein
MHNAREMIGGAYEWPLELPLMAVSKALNLRVGGGFSFFLVLLDILVNLVGEL